MNNYIVTTTIHEPTEALKKFASLPDWKLIVVGDLKTPHEAYKDFNCLYMHPDYQEQKYPELSKAIGWNKIMRRNLGFVEAYKLGARVVASVDDDNIPYDTWGKYLAVNQLVEIGEYTNIFGPVFDPMQMTNHPEFWHRGYPPSLTKHKSIYFVGNKKKAIFVQADLWDGDPDVDAICRILYNPKNLTLKLKVPFTTKEYVPFNSQNTFLSSYALPYYMCLPYVGRMDDIWGAYLFEYLTTERPLFMPASVRQERNEQSLEKNMQDEVMGYTHTLELITHMENWRDIMPKETVEAFDIYQGEYKKG